MTDEEIVKNAIKETQLLCFTLHEADVAKSFSEEVAMKVCKAKEKEILEKVKEFFGGFIIPCAQKNMEIGCLRIDGNEMIKMFLNQFENE